MGHRKKIAMTQDIIDEDHALTVDPNQLVGKKLRTLINSRRRPTERIPTRVSELVDLWTEIRGRNVISDWQYINESGKVTAFENNKGTTLTEELMEECVNTFTNESCNVDEALNRGCENTDNVRQRKGTGSLIVDEVTYMF